MATLFRKEIDKITQASIKNAGPRYTPTLDPRAPNIEISHLVECVDSLVVSSELSEKLESLADDLRKAWANPPKVLKQAFHRRKQNPDLMVATISEMASFGPGKHTAHIRSLLKCGDFISNVIHRVQQESWERERASNNDSNERQKERSLQEEVRKVSSAIHAILEYIRSVAGQVIEKNRLFISGEWGTGKTHFLCDLASNRLSSGRPTLLLLAHTFSYGCDPLSFIVKKFKRIGSIDGLLEQLDREGRRGSQRALLIIDGVNEGDRMFWRKRLAHLARYIRRYSNIGLIVSCRSPYEHSVLTKPARWLYAFTVHRGLEDEVFDAQFDFFTHYNIPVPSYPVLDTEFSRPLFLIILCKAIANLSKKSQKRSLQEVASGQKGMTYLFEAFIKEVGKRIERDFNLPRLTCWRLLKGGRSLDGHLSEGIAGLMASAEPKDYVARAEALDVVTAFTGYSDPRSVENVLNRLIVDGLLVEDVMLIDGTWQDVIRLPYQRFSDHLIARHLLEKHLNVSTENSIRRSFYKNQPLGRVFQINQWTSSYDFPGLASAIMLEFPERVKHVIPGHERELVYYLPVHLRLLRPLVDTFIDGLHWRSRDSFSAQTGNIVSQILKRCEPNV